MGARPSRGRSRAAGGTRRGARGADARRGRRGHPGARRRVRPMSARPGIVYLVGAGPGDPGLITARALELIESADAILFDRLIPAVALQGARPDDELRYVGKQPGDASVAQERIHEEMVERARRGLSVVRLKGGDPFVFGRGGEEAEALADAGIEFEVVPGVTAGVAAAGRDPSEPAAAIERGTHPAQRTVTATLAELPRAVDAAAIKPPTILLFGPVARRRETIAWLERRPLHGRRVVVTRARAQASGLATTLRALGAEVVELPAIRVEPRLDSAEVRDAVAGVHTYALVCLTSPNGVRLLFEAMAEQGRDARALSNSTIAAIGPGTATALAERGVLADIVPERFVAESLVEALAPVEVAERPVLVARAAEARDVLPNALAERGAKVDVVALYGTVREEPDAAAIEAARNADYVTFTSSSTVRNLLDVVGDGFPRGARVVSIGPVTSATAREAGLEVAVEAERHDPDGLVEALLEDAKPG